MYACTHEVMERLVREGRRKGRGGDERGGEGMGGEEMGGQGSGGEWRVEKCSGGRGGDGSAPHHTTPHHTQLHMDTHTHIHTCSAVLLPTRAWPVTA